jgi:hypothetical protein
MPVNFLLREDHPPVSLFRPSGESGAMNVEHGKDIEAPGELVEEIDDAYIVEHNGERKAWPKATWELPKGTKPKVDDKPAAKAVKES